VIELNGSSLTVASLAAVAEKGERVCLAPSAREQMKRAREVVEEAIASNAAVYGLTTAVAERKRVRLDAAGRARLNASIIATHRITQGPLAQPRVVRAAMTCLLNSFAKGASGVRPELADVVMTALNDGPTPEVRILGSVGQADLGPMAAIADGLLSASAFVPQDNEGLALLNSNAFSTGWAAIALYDAERLLDNLDVAAALDLEGFCANATLFHSVAAELRPYPGIRTTIERLAALLSGSFLLSEGSARNLQDPLSFRCVPQLHGAARDAFSYARQVAETELNSAQGNPVVVLSERRIISVANFEIVPLAAALDFARIALASAVGSASERTVKLLQSPLSGLAPGLSEAPETGDDALAELAVASQAIAVEARLLAQPVSFELSSTSKAEGLEDRTTMAPLAARRLSEMLELTARVIAIELVVAAQAVDLRGSRPLGTGTSAAYEAVRARARYVAKGTVMVNDLEPLAQDVLGGHLAF
jgi:histidine ammonia-lyase